MKRAPNHPAELARRIGIAGEDLATLEMALTHPSFAYENPQAPQEHNQRLEFLGDAVLGLVIGEQLFARYPAWTEGELSRRRAAVVCEANLADGARRLQLGAWLKLGRGEEASGGREKPSILADALEAVIGALFLSGGVEAARRFILDLFGDALENAQNLVSGDNKTAFQEWVQRTGPADIRYCIVDESGPDHDKRFVAAVMVNGTVIADGQGRTKKEAEQQAAGRAMREWAGRKG
ncbi:ribonuclease III [Heliobacterium undosum]|uniref:Ribonuclease 3 n=1 Tax=Heliomicrobium undosum TaxID=121734 RepID=A0A845L262_9FIRM|nr:ribonuclease III [Heliomicrobium undosum]MZP29085.1 ribonuclease III [Heliomicrobium undosum]